MAAIQILPVAAVAADSADVTVAAGAPLTVALKGVIAGDARVRISLKDDAAGYQIVEELNSSRPALVISGPGTYRFSRVVGGTCGVFSA
jgi:hypothetical protein